jgi:hypothetical protein
VINLFSFNEDYIQLIDIRSKIENLKPILTQIKISFKCHRK